MQWKKACASCIPAILTRPSPGEEGRRVPRTLGTKGPVASDIGRALNRIGIPCDIEEHHHPAHWARHEGRVIVTWTGKKEALIKKVARNLVVKR